MDVVMEEVPFFLWMCSFLRVESRGSCLNQEPDACGNGGRVRPRPGREDAQQEH